MAKIPRVSQGDRPSAVPSGPLPTAGEAVGIIKAVGGLVDIGVKIAAEVEEKEARILQKAREDKQAIVNEVAAGRMAGDFEETLSGYAERFKKELWDNPEEASGQLLDAGRLLADRQLEQAPNTQVGLTSARHNNVRIGAAVREMENWAQSRQTQKAKGDAEAIINRAAGAAEHLTSMPQLGTLLAGVEPRYGEMLRSVFGPQAEEKLNEVRERAVEGFVLVNGARDPVGVLAALDAGSGPLVDYATPGKRDTWRRKTELSLENRGETAKRDLLFSATGETRTAVEMLNQGRLDAGTVLALQNRNINAQKAMAINPSYTKTQRDDQIALLKKQGEILDAIEDIRRRGTKYDPAEQVDGDTAALFEMDKTMRKLNGQKDLLILAEQQDRLILLRRERKISEAKYQTMWATVNLALTKALEAEAKKTGHGPLGLFQSAREAGNEELNSLFKGELKNATPKQQLEARMNYARQYIEATKDDREIDEATSRRFAREAGSYETGRRLRGID